MRPKITIITIFICLTLLAFALPSFGSDRNTYFKIPIKTLLSEPSKDANKVYDIPVDVKILGISEDGNWYKVRIEFDFVFLGHYKYTGWAYAPVSDILAEKNLTVNR